MRIAVTGASGFIGAAVVRAARAEGHEVAALSRSGGGGTVACDLGAPDAAGALGRHLRGAEALIHAAAAMSGDAARLRRDTLDATAAVLDGARSAGVGRVVLVGSVSAYDVAAMPEGAVLDEWSPVVDPDAAPDPYAGAKRAQEAMLTGSGLPHVLARAGAVHGPGRDWSAQVGFRVGGRVVCPAAEASVPAVHVGTCARALVRLATMEVPPAVANLIDPDPPSRAAWVRALGLRHVSVPLGAILAAAGPLRRRDRFAARFQPVRYDTATMRDLVGDTPSFADAFAADRRAAAR